MRIFVFGSNLSGHHGRGAALTAKHPYGARQYVGVGPQGRAYALATKGARTPEGHYPVLPLDDIKWRVDNFLDYARFRPHETFLVTRIGCGLAGYTDEQIAPMFISAPENCEFDPAWARSGLKTWTEAP
jgi:hypothetical protein